MARGDVYTKRVWSANFGQNVAQDSPPVPEGVRWVLRDLVLNGGAAAGHVTLWILSGTDFIVLFNGDLEPGFSQHLELRQAMETGESLRGHSPDTGWSVLITAYELGAPA